MIISNMQNPRKKLMHHIILVFNLKKDFTPKNLVPTSEFTQKTSLNLIRDSKTKFCLSLNLNQSSIILKEKDKLIVHCL